MRSGLRIAVLVLALLPAGAALAEDAAMTWPDALGDDGSRPSPSVGL